ncbi:MAG: tetraacyldisaccharide 4'-kinase [Methylococcaceae bacterium]|nr:MAG: tetraacyldisaccharide 4'-kinase [Methylococcaceae bacterium]
MIRLWLRRLATECIERLWYGERPCFCLLPLANIYRAVAGFKRRLYQAGWLRSERLPLPVIVVGNISVGGAGKTPLTVWIVEWLRAQGYRPGVVSRGYGGQAQQWPQRVTVDSDPRLVGDEPVLMARRTQCPLAVAPRRAEAARLLLAECDVIVADDGLQHYALARDIEIAVIDGVRRHGNGACLPAGPLREPAARLAGVDLCVCNGGAPQSGEYAMSLHGDTAVNMIDDRRRLLAEFAGTVHALAGIGHPRRFFEHLRWAGVSLQERPLPDHHVFSETDLEFGDSRPVLMTEKDAVKCAALADIRHWYVPVTARLDPAFGPRLLQLLQEKTRGRTTA